jgi:transcriptional regulator with XRE-family HTH domain
VQSALRNCREELVPFDSSNNGDKLTGHALRNANLRERSLARAETAPLLARLIVQIRAKVLGMTRLELARRSGISRGTLRDIELGIHVPTRRVVQQFAAFCRQRAVSPQQLEELLQLYAGPCDTLARFLARLELRAGSPFELARRVGISHATLWEYRRGHFPLPLALLRRMCLAVAEDPAPAEPLWYKSERQRFLERGYPEALAEFWTLCARQGHVEKHLLTMGLGTRAARRLRYLELPPWTEVAKIAASLCREERELQALKKLWLRDERGQATQILDRFGSRLKELRQKQAISRRDLADLFGIGGKKPARIIKHIEEDGYYSALAYPAGLVALLTEKAPEPKLLELWQQRRHQFHRRHRPETRTDLRLARELYGFGPDDMETILGYSPVEYQRIERGVALLTDTARARILHAVHGAGERRIEALLEQRNVRQADDLAWRAPGSVTGMITLLARREGGLIPLARHLKNAGCKGHNAARLRELATGRKLPAWPVLDEIGRACDVADLADVRHDWAEKYRARVGTRCASPLGIEVRLLIAEVAETVRAFSARLGLSSSVLVRNLQRMDRDEPVKWGRIEHILRAAGLPAECDRWKEMRALWYTASARRKMAPSVQRRPMAKD